MTEHTVFSKKHAETMAQDQRAILEELNLPPEVIKFLRGNAQIIQIVLIVAVLAILGWEGYGKYTSTQQNRSANMLYEAMKVDGDQRVTQLKALSAKYGASGSGLWGTIELGHVAFKEGKFDEAASLYESTLGSVSADSPLFPLVQYNLAQAYENLQDQAKAKAAYQKLAEIKGFSGEAMLGLARIAEIEGKPDEARTQYQAYVDLPETKAGPTKEWAQDKIHTLTPKKEQ